MRGRREALYRPLGRRRSRGRQQGDGRAVAGYGEFSDRREPLLNGGPVLAEFANSHGFHHLGETWFTKRSSAGRNPGDRLPRSFILTSFFPEQEKAGGGPGVEALLDLRQGEMRWSDTARWSRQELAEVGQPTPAPHQTGRADFPHSAFREPTSQSYRCSLGKRA